MNRILAIIAGIGGILSAVLYALLGREKVKAAEDKQEQAETAKTASDNATEALVKGVTNESKPITRNGRRIK